VTPGHFQHNGLYEAKTAEDWIAAYLLCRAAGIQLFMLLGFENCQDNCGIKSDRWERVDVALQSYYRCRECRRFIGWIKEESTPPTSKRKRAA
jgi:hypothetical protein